MKKAIVLSSGGVDSSTCVSIAVRDYGKENVATVSVFYGQKHSKELECARAVAEFYSLPHYEFDLSSVMKYSDCSLLSSSSKEIESGSYSERKSRDADGKVSTYVPFRNGLMLSVCASLAQSIFADDETDIIFGAHSDDSAGNAYADCSEEFVSAISSAVF